MGLVAEERSATWDIGLARSGDRASVVVGQDDDRLAGRVRPKDVVVRNIEVVAAPTVEIVECLQCLL